MIIWRGYRPCLRQNKITMSPEEGQLTTVTIADPDGAQESGLVIVNTPGNVAEIFLSWTPDCGDEGTYVLQFTATDDFILPGVTEINLVIEVACTVGEVSGPSKTTGISKLRSIFEEPCVVAHRTADITSASSA